MTNSSDNLEIARTFAFRVWGIIGVIALLLGAGYVLGHIWTSVSVALVAAFLVFTLHGPVDWLARHKVPRTLAVALSYLLLFVIVALIVLVFVPPIIDQSLLFAQNLPSYYNSVRDVATDLLSRNADLMADETFGEIVTNLNNYLSSNITALISGFSGRLFDIGSGIVEVCFVLGISMVVGFWVLVDLPKISREIRVLNAGKHADLVEYVGQALSVAFGGYFRGVLVAAICFGVVSGIIYSLLGLPFALILGLLAALCYLVPMIGPWIAAISAGLIGLFLSPLTAVLALILTIVGQQLIDNFITPRVMSNTVALHPAFTLIGIVAGGALGGVFGMICAIPLTAAAKAVFVYWFEARTGRVLASDDGAFFPHSRKYTKTSKRLGKKLKLSDELLKETKK